MASNEAVLVENAVSKLYYPQFKNIEISTFLNEHFQLVQFHLKPSNTAKLEQKENQWQNKWLIRNLGETLKRLEKS